MRKNIAAGLVLAGAAVVLFWLSGVLDLEVEPVALLGLGVGAVLALVPDASAVTRVVSFAVGVLVSTVAYIGRAGVLPDTDQGRAVATVVVILICVGVYAASLGHLPLWASLLGAGALAGAYEIDYTAAPPQVLSTSLDTATSVLLAVAFGFAAVALFAGDRVVTAATTPTRRDPAPHDPAVAADRHRLDTMMEAGK